MKKFLFLFVCLFGFTLTVYADDAVVLFRVPEQVTVGSPFRVDVLLNANEQSVNALSGKVSLIGPAEVRRVVQNSSIIPLWVSGPSFSTSTVTYEGIIPGGFDGVYDVSSQDRVPGSIISFYVFPRAVGDITLSSQTVAYKNDGFGTVLSLRDSTSTVRSVDVLESSTDSVSLWLFGLSLVCVIIILLWFFKIFFVKRHS